ncbi:MAG: type IV pilus modification protein PilV [Vitreoscilla sp.]|nr:type IV pilus modification protein PilV [Vitreoscilla sp.]
MSMKRSLRAQRGASLIEVLVSILIVSVGIVSLAGLLAKSTQLAKASEFRSVAGLLAADMADRVKANIPAVTAGTYDMTPAALQAAAPGNAATACISAAAACTSAQMAAYDLSQWQQTLFNGLPNGTGYLQYDAVGQAVDLWLAWLDPTALAVGNDEEYKNLTSNCPAAFQALDPRPSCMYFRVGL